MMYTVRIALVCAAAMSAVVGAALLFAIPKLPKTKPEVASVLKKGELALLA